MSKHYFPQRVTEGNNFNSGLLPFFIFFIAFVAITPILSFFGWRGIYTLVFFLLFVSIYALRKGRGLKWWFIGIILLILSTSTVTAMYWADPRYIVSLIFLISALYAIQFVDKIIIDKVVDIASYFFLVMLVLAVMGFFLAQSGVDPVLKFPNPDGRPNYFFYLTLTNSYLGNFIRPSGIYDEPGTLSFYVTFVAAMRHLLKKDNKLTWILLIFGFITFSLAHLIYVFFHFLSEKFSKKNTLRFSGLITLLIVFLFSSGIHQIFSDRLISRLVVSEDGSIAGDNRSFRMINVVDLIEKNSYVFWFGADPSCRFDYSVCKQLFPLMGENPLSPLAFQGFLVSWPYYLSVFMLVLSPLFGRRYLVCMGIALILIQRPAVTGLGGAMITVMVIYLMIDSIAHRLNNKRVNPFLERKSSHLQ